MSTKSPYQISLGPKILNRARLILGSLLLFVTIFVVAGIHQGVVSGDFDKTLLQPFRQFSADLGKTLESAPTPSLTPVLTPASAAATSTSSSTTKVIINQTIPAPPKIQQTQPVVANCIRKNIREGEFAGNKCYPEQDFEDLEYYLDRYSSARSSLAGADASMKITCEGSDFSKDFFKDSCERDKQQKSQAESDISKYKGIIQGLIAKGH